MRDGEGCGNRIKDTTREVSTEGSDSHLTGKASECSRIPGLQAPTLIPCLPAPTLLQDYDFFPHYEVLSCPSSDFDVKVIQLDKDGDCCSCLGFFSLLFKNVIDGVSYT